MPKTFELEILKRERALYHGRAVSLTVPAEYGYLGILADHAPFIGHLVKGRISFTASDGHKKTVNSPDQGFVRVNNNRVSVFLYSRDETLKLIYAEVKKHDIG
jgi:F0F1-type ATP synthase epsilon subunit